MEIGFKGGLENVLGRQTLQSMILVTRTGYKWASWEREPSRATMANCFLFGTTRKKGGFCYMLVETNTFPGWPEAFPLQSQRSSRGIVAGDYSKVWG